ncbi:MAG: Spy/CpxP family protein refolding chaperone [Rubrivivax sp.]|nr:Spy/CpxP family protein refolding chaperone [Rubrivivax sp.]
MRRIHKIIAGTVGTLALVAMTAVVAAPGGPYGGCDGSGPGAGPMGMMGYGGMGPGGRAGMGPGGYGMHGFGPGMMSEEGLAQLKTQLAITPQQEPAWQAFATTAAEQAALMQATREQHWAAAQAGATAPERMAQHAGAMTQHLAGMQAMSAAFTELYAVLTPEQRKQVDSNVGRMHGRGYGYRFGPGGNG